MKKNLTIFITLLIISNSHSQCKDIFIGNVYQFKNNDLFFANVFDNNNSDYYIDIFFKDEFDKNNLDLMNTDGSVDFRQDIKKNNATKIFNLKGLDTIYFYNSKLNDLIGYGTYKKAEYYENMIESRFIASYKPYISDYTQIPYYASNCKINNKESKWTKSENKDLENKIIKTYNINKSSILKIYHFTNYESNTTYSMVSYDYLKVSYDFPHLNSFIFKSKNGKLTKIYETGSDYILDSFLISAFTFNNEPIILVVGSRPETDIFINAPIFYDGIKYNFKEEDRSGSKNIKGRF